jgi:hypothetical protein
MFAAMVLHKKTLMRFCAARTAARHCYQNRSETLYTEEIGPLLPNSFQSSAGEVVAHKAA